MEQFLNLDESEEMAVPVSVLRESRVMLAIQLGKAWPPPALQGPLVLTSFGSPTTNQSLFLALYGALGQASRCLSGVVLLIIFSSTSSVGVQGGRGRTGSAGTNSSRQYPELLQRLASDLQILLGEVQNLQHWLLDVLQLEGPSKVALPINEAILEPERVVWHTPASCAPALIRAKRWYFVSNHHPGSPF